MAEGGRRKKRVRSNEKGKGRGRENTTNLFVQFCLLLHLRRASSRASKERRELVLVPKSRLDHAREDPRKRRLDCRFEESRERRRSRRELLIRFY